MRTRTNGTGNAPVNAPPLHILYLVSVAGLLSVGQVLLKIVALRAADAAPGAGLLINMLSIPLFWITGVVYGLVMVFWVWILTFIPLSLAYPFLMLSLVIVPILCYFFLSETITSRYWIGLALMTLGAYVLVQR